MVVVNFEKIPKLSPLEHVSVEGLNLQLCEFDVTFPDRNLLGCRLNWVEHCLDFVVDSNPLVPYPLSLCGFSVEQVKTVCVALCLHHQRLDLVVPLVQHFPFLLDLSMERS